MRTSVLISGAIVLIMLASACSSGKEKGSGPRTTHTTARDSSTIPDSVVVGKSSSKAR
jgi:hypothetical protein